MAKPTLVIDDQVLQAACIKALQEGTSVNEICHAAIARYAAAGRPDAAERLERFRAISRQIAASATSDFVWPGRKALYDDMLKDRMYGNLPDADATTAVAAPRKQKRRP